MPESTTLRGLRWMFSASAASTAGAGSVWTLIWAFGPSPSPGTGAVTAWVLMAIFLFARRALQTESLPTLTMPDGWGPASTIKVSKRGSLWAAWTDEPKGILVFGDSLAKVLGKFPTAKAEVEAARSSP
jgi:hypothetical protein